MTETHRNQQATAPRRGRPRSEATELCIIETVMHQIEQGKTLSTLSVEGIAAQAGVGKATIYRRWPNKEALLFDAIVRTELPEPEYHGETLRDQLVQGLEYLRVSALARRDQSSLAAFVAELRATPELYRRYHAKVIEPRRARLRELLAQGVATGEIRADVDLDLLGELIVGPMLSRTLLRPDAPLDDPSLSAKMVDTVLQGISPRTDGT